MITDGDGDGDRDGGSGDRTRFPARAVTCSATLHG